jgi:hypothetical protein
MIYKLEEEQQKHMAALKHEAEQDSPFNQQMEMSK